MTEESLLPDHTRDSSPAAQNDFFRGLFPQINHKTCPHHLTTKAAYEAAFVSLLVACFSFLSSPKDHANHSLKLAQGVGNGC